MEQEHCFRVACKIISPNDGVPSEINLTDAAKVDCGKNDTWTVRFRSVILDLI